MPGLLQISTFGGLSIQRNGQPLTGFASRKVEALLVYLACNRRTQRRELLAELLWEERSQARAMGNLRVALTSLRKELDDFVLIERDTVAINPDADVRLDAAEFEETLSLVQDQGSIRSGELAAEVERVTMDLYQGEFLESFHITDSRGFLDWASRQRERLGRLAVDGLYELVKYDLANGAYQVGLRHAARLLELDPLMEAAHRGMMQLLACCGQRKAALAQYEACRQILEEELGIQPAEETARLYEQIRAGELKAPLVAAFPKIEVTARLPAFLIADSKVEIQQPLFVARERQFERLEGFLNQALSGQVGLAFVTGGPGRGKTALLEAFTRRAMQAHSDLLAAGGACNQYAGIGDPYLPWREIMSMLSGDIEARWAAGAISTEHARRLWAALPSLVEALLAHGPHLLESFVPGKSLLARAALALPAGSEALEALRAALERQADSAPGLGQSHIFEQFSNLLRAVADERPLLLVLDDLQWADASSISLLFHLGRRLASARILILGAYRPEEVALGRDSSRHPLEKVVAEFKRQYGDTWIDLASIEELEGRQLVDALLDSEPNQLGGDFREALYLRTSGQPLFTIELLRAMQSRGDLQQNERGRWVTGPSLDWERLPARVEAVIEERIARLEDKLRQILSVASVEGEDFTAQVLARLQEVSERDLLHALSAELEKRHRLVREGGELFVGDQVLSRYRFAHTLFQSYFYNSLSQGERRLLHRQVAGALEALYAGQTEEIAGQLAYHYAGDVERERHYTRLAGERAAARYANAEALRYFDRALELTSEEDLPGRFDLLLAREGVLDLQGERQAQWRDLGTLEQLAKSMNDGHKQARIAIRQANYARRIVDLPLVVMYARQGIRLAEVIQDVGWQAEAYMYWGWALTFQGLVQAARAPLEQALGLARRAGLRDIEAHVLRIIGVGSGDLKNRSYYEQALNICHQAGDLQGETMALNNLGTTFHDSGDFSNAITCYEGALAISQKIGDRALAGSVINNLAYLYLATDNIPRAEDYAKQGYQICCETGQRRWEGSFLDVFGHICALQGDHLQAKDYFGKALAMAREVEVQEDEHIALCSLSFLYNLLGDYPAALALGQQALQLVEGTRYSRKQADALAQLGRAHEGLADLDQATMIYCHTLELRYASNQPHLATECLAGLARLSLVKGDIPQAQAHVEQILSYLESKRLSIARASEEDREVLDPLNGTWEPHRIYLTCYRVLKAAGDPRAEAILCRGYNRLKASAATIDDDEKRKTFFKNVPSNRELLRAWAERESD